MKRKTDIKKRTNKARVKMNQNQRKKMRRKQKETV